MAVRFPAFALRKTELLLGKEFQGDSSKGLSRGSAPTRARRQGPTRLPAAVVPGRDPAHPVYLQRYDAEEPEAGVLHEVPAQHQDAARWKEKARVRGWLPHLASGAAAAPLPATGKNPGVGGARAGRHPHAVSGTAITGPAAPAGQAGSARSGPACPGLRLPPGAEARPEADVSCARPHLSLLLP